MRTHNTRELIGADLDAAVLKALGKPYLVDPMPIVGNDPLRVPQVYAAREDDPSQPDLARGPVRPSLDWAYGGALIGLHDWLLPYRSRPERAHLGAFSSQTPAGFEYNGPAPLIAAMRAFVASKLGDKVELT
jgi:hypothetical protein